MNKPILIPGKGQVGMASCNHHGFLVPTVIIPMNIPVPIPPNSVAANPETPQMGMQTIFRTVEALCVRCGHVFTFQIQQAPPPEEPKKD
jgi:hypothetical protein